MIYAKKNIIDVGNIVKTHGVQGSLLLRLNSGFNASVMLLQPWCFLKIREKPVPFKIFEVVELSPSEVILHLAEVNSKPEAEQFINYGLAVEKNKSVRKRKTENINLLLGYKVFNNQKFIGTIHEIEDTGKQFLFVLDNELLIPAHDDLIVSIDDKSGAVYMSLPDGLV